MKKKQAQDLIKLSNTCPECESRYCMNVVEGFINVGNYFLRCEECGYEYDD